MEKTKNRITKNSNLIITNEKLGGLTKDYTFINPPLSIRIYKLLITIKCT